MQTNQTYTRELSLTRAKMDPKQRTVELSFSDELPVLRNYGFEVLSHDEGAADLSRLNNGAGPLLWQHDTREAIGKVLKAWIGPDRKGRAVVKFNNSQRAKDLWADISESPDLAPSISVGYTIQDMKRDGEQDGQPVFRATKWAALEVSCVACPASPFVGIGRSATDSQKISIMDNNSQNSRETEIRGIASNLAKIIPNAPAEAERAVLSGEPLETFRKRMLDMLPAPVKPVQTPILADCNQRDMQRYSFSRAVAEFAETGKLSGVEAEANQEYTRVYGQPKGFWAPSEVMGRSLVAGTASLGGNLVPTEHMGDEFITALKARMLVTRLGARLIPGLHGNVVIPKQTGTSTASWKTEIEAATQSYPTFGQVSLTPKACTAYVVYSKQALLQGSPALDQLVRDDVISQIALAVESAVLRGIGSSEPQGIIKIPAAGGAATAVAGVNLITIGANGGAITYDKLVEMESAIAADNADSANMKFLTNSAVRGALRKAMENTVSGAFCWTSPVGSSDPTEGRLLGIPAFVSNVVPSNVTKGTLSAAASCIYLANWSDLLIGQWGNGIDCLTDIYSAAGTRQIKLYGTLYTDAALRNNESFAVIADVET